MRRVTFYGGPLDGRIVNDLGPVARLPVLRPSQMRFVSEAEAEAVPPPPCEFEEYDRCYDDDFRAYYVRRQP